MESTNIVQNFRASPKKYEHIEGVIKEFPDQLREQASSNGCKDFLTSIWQAGKQSLTQSLRGNPIKFAQIDDPNMIELPSGRFWYNSQKQVIVVGIPKKDTPSGFRYVIVKYTGVCIGPIGLENWAGHHWKVWKPKDNYSGYYQDLPPEVIRPERYGQAPRQTSSDDDNRRLSGTASSEVTQLVEVPAVLVRSGRDFNRMDITTTTSKRKLPSDTQPESSSFLSKRTRIRSHHRQKENPIASPIFPQHGRGRDQDAVRPLPIHGDKEQRNLQTVPLEKSVAIGHISSVKTEDDTKDLVDVKSEFTAALTMTANGGGSLTSGLKISRNANEACESSAVCSSRKVYPTSATEVGNGSTKDHAIDLTTEDTCEIIWGRNVLVYFKDRQNITRRVVTFDQCNTARRLFEEACAFKVANLATRMLQVEILGIGPVQIRRDDDDHFEMMVLAPINTILPNLLADQTIHLEVSEFLSD